MLSVSLEALAMTGVDCHEVGICIEEWEAEDLEETPAHLLAEEDEEEEDGRRRGGGGEVGRDNKYGCVRCPNYLKNINLHAKHNDGCNGDYKDNEDDLVIIKRNRNVGFDEVGICIEEWEAEDLEETPAHLLAEEDEEEEEGRRGGGGGDVRRDDKYGGVRHPNCLKNINRHAKHNDGYNGDYKDNEDDLVTINRNQNVGFDGMVDAINLMVKAILRLP